ncbi:MAG: hypothetical protein ACI8ZB_003134 [Desulforhopalus sp.]|jgi:hypothetical protein
MPTSYSCSPSSVNSDNLKSNIASDIPGGKTRITCPLTVVNGLDFLKVSFWLDWDSNTLFRELESLKVHLQTGEEKTFPYHAPGGFDWNLHRKGTQNYSYRLTSGDLTLMFNNRKSDGVVPNARLEIGSVSCWSPGFFTIYERIYSWLQALGATFVRESVSEVHLAADFINVDIKSLEIENEDRWVSKVHKFDIHNHRRKLSGITLGKGNIMLRVYDKVLELQNSPHKQIVFSEIWNSIPYDKHPVTRLEFQLRRTVLKQFENKIETVKDLLFALNALWKYCTQSWSRFCKQTVNRNHNQSKALNSDFWQSVVNVSWSGVHEIERKKRRQNKNLDQIRSNMRGMAMTMSAFYDANPEDLDHIIALCQKLLAEDLTRLYKDDQHTFIERMKRKRNEIYVNI